MNEVQQRISQLRAKIASLEILREDLGETFVEEKIRALQQELNALLGEASHVEEEEICPTVQSGEQSIAIAGDVQQSTIIHAQTVVLAERFWKGHPRMVDLQRATQAYLEYVLERHSYLNFKGMGVSDRIPVRLALLDLYVPLKARLELPEGETWKREMTLAGRELRQKGSTSPWRLSQSISLLDLVREADGLIILGDPGAGKTTFLKYLALRMAKGEGPQLGLDHSLPILLPLAAYANALQSREVRLDDFITHYFDEIGLDVPMAAMLREALRLGHALILLDGLDEVRDLNLRNTVVERVVDFYTFHRRAGNKFVITSRVVGYRAVRPVAEGLIECTLVDFDEEDIQAFVEHWTMALEKQAQGDTPIARADAEKEKRELLDAIRRNPGIRRLAATPLLLTILALMKRQGVTLPERRVQLYDEHIKTLLSTWNRARSLSGRAPGRELDEIQTVRVLAPLALWMHQVNPGMGLVRAEEIRRKLEQIFYEQGEINPALAARQFLQDVRDHAALLVERGPGEYGFIHLTFEEYLAAVAIALHGQGSAQPVIEMIQPYIGEQSWREVLLLTIAYLGIRQQLPKVAGEVVEALLQVQQQDSSEAILLAGEAVLDTWPGGVPPRTRETVIQALIPLMQNANVRPSLRRRAGLILGRLGWRPADLERFVEVPPGEFLFGRKKEPRRIPYRYWIARYPVSNLQFARFVQSGGYQRREFWSEAGWEWRTGKYDTAHIEVLERDWLEHRPPQQRNLPYYWHHPELGNPICPVVGINWYEAEAYCRWLTTQIISIPPGYVVRLPTEEEWERAARGTEGWEYPWGEEFQRTAANTWESAPESSSGLGGTTPVCTYPQGVSPVGAWDMSGNVWEWINAWYDEEHRYRVVRGGSWIGYQWFARTSFCNWSIPLTFNDDLGFRPVIAPEHPEEVL
uniref:Signal transduction protein n=1 Tax=uncultured Chloroflexota bacterium TaxID=166587 RepID=H5SAK5_9CHLR|nr:signal transduction protein [uncultured Chloroflexota bacterium]